MILGKDYKLRDDLYDPKQEGVTLPIELLTPPYDGVIIRYNTVQIQEEEDGAKVKFSYDVVKPGKLTHTGLEKDNKFRTALGLILNAMILEVVEADANRTNDTEKPDSE